MDQIMLDPLSNKDGPSLYLVPKRMDGIQTYTNNQDTMHILRLLLRINLLQVPKYTTVNHRICIHSRANRNSSLLLAHTSNHRLSHNNNL